MSDHFQLCTKTIEKAKAYRQYARSKGNSLSGIVYYLLQQELGEPAVSTVARFQGTDLFNAKQKYSFAKTNQSERGRKSIITIFKRTAPLEEQYGKDICEWDTEQLCEFFSNYRSSHISGRRCFAIVKNYFTFCKGNGIQNSKAIFSLWYSDKLGVQIVSMQKSTKEKPVNISNLLQGEPLEARIAYWLLFIGFGLSAINRFRPKHIDFETLTITIGSKSIAIFPEAIPDFASYVNNDNPKPGYALAQVINPDKAKACVRAGRKLE